MQCHRILVIDDNQAIHEDFKKILCPEEPSSRELAETEAALFGQKPAPIHFREFEIDSAFQGRDGLDLVKKSLQDKRPYALVFVDVRMPPGWDGVETATKIWQLDPLLQIVICTAYSDYSWDEMVARLGISDRIVILKKPFDNVEVIQLAHALAEKWRLREQVQVKMEQLEAMVAGRTQELRAANEKLKAEMAERVQAEETLRQAQKIEALGQLASGVAHDFNNILTVIDGYCSMSLETLDHAGQLQKNITEIQSASERAASLTRQLLAFSRKQVLQPRVLQLNEVVHDMEKMLRRLIGEHIELSTVFDPALGRVKADAGQLEQVMMNLAVNARDAMPRGGKLIISTSNIVIDQTLKCRNRTLDAGEYILLAVSDNGVGMTDDVKTRLFEPFFTTKGLGKGTGLGLATCYGIISQIGGDIQVSSEPNRGTTFQIYLPRTDALVEPSAVADISEMPAGTESVLVVEDDPDVRKLAAVILHNCGYQIQESNSAFEALELVRRSPHFDLVLSDVIMPQMSGKELSDQLKGQFPQTKILLMSGYTDDALAHHGVLEERFLFLEKPFSPAKLARKVREVLDLQPVS